jgi:hypothetical protein
LFQDELGGVFREVGRVAVQGEQAADFSAEVGADAFAVGPVEFRHALNHLREFAGHEAELVGLHHFFGGAVFGEGVVEGGFVFVQAEFLSVTLGIPDPFASSRSWLIIWA